jgi:hypothetical protein
VPSGNTGTVQTGGRNYLDVDGSGNVIFGGGMRGTIAWNNDITTSGQGFGGEALALKYDAEGNLLFAKTFGGISEDRVDSASFNTLGDIIVSGMGRGTATFDSFTHEAPGVGNFAYIGKITSIILRNPDQETEALAVWPSPVSEELHFSGTGPVSGIIYNAIGQKIKEFQSSPSQAVNVADLPQGVYIIRTNANGSLRFVKS